MTLRLDAFLVIKGYYYRNKGREKDHDLYPGQSHWMILCLTNMTRYKLSGQVVFRTFFHFSQNYIMLMQFATDAVQVMAELVRDSSEQWSLIKIQNIWVELF